MILPTLFILLNAIFSIALGETGCPPPETIAPCKCSKSPSTRLVCANISTLDVIDKVIENSKRYTYQEVHLESTVIIYIPATLFKEINIKELYLNNVKVVTLFNYPPGGINSLYKLHINNTSIQQTLAWNHLTNFTKLKEISISNMNMRLSSSLSEHLPESVTHLSFYNAKIKKILPGTLEKAVNLDKFAVESCNLNNLSRDIFPKPFNGRILSFNDNNITTINEDLFTDMPHLQFLSMKNNQISAIPESAFKGRTHNVPYFDFEGNPLRCDCLLVWLIRDKPEIIKGSCETPSRLRGRKLQDLRPGDFNC